MLPPKYYGCCCMKTPNPAKTTIPILLSLITRIQYLSRVTLSTPTINNSRTKKAPAWSNPCKL